MTGKFIKFMLAVALTVGLSSCYKEDMSLCLPESNVHLRLQLDENVKTRTTSKLRLAEYAITGMRVWVFDEDDYMVDNISVPYDSDGQYDIFMNLPVGEYDFVVWSGNGMTYKVANETGYMNDMYIQFDAAKDILYDNIPDLLYGTVRDCSIAEGVENDIVIDMCPNTYNINLSVDGMIRSEEKWEVAINNVHIHHTFDNHITKRSKHIKHVRQGKLNGNSMFNTSIRTLNITYDRYMELTMRNVMTDKVLFSENLYKTIIDTYAANNLVPDFDSIHTYDIVMGFNAEMDVTISVNGWQYTPQETALE